MANKTVGGKGASSPNRRALQAPGPGSVAKEKSRLTKVELYVIRAVKEKREALNMNQAALSKKMGVSHSFVGHVESIRHRTKYNFNHLNKLAEIFGCSLGALLPRKPIRDNEWPPKE
jgi:ribosome-binding protein aMBF1 (putative translation factor)